MHVEEIRARWLGAALIEDGFSPIERRETPEFRELTLWGALTLRCNRTSGVVTRLVAPADEEVVPRFRATWIDEAPLRRSFCRKLVARALATPPPFHKLAAERLDATLCLSPDGRGSASRWRRALTGWLLDPRLVAATRAAFGPDFSLREYGWFAEERALVERTARTPALLPILGWLLHARGRYSLGTLETELFGDAANRSIPQLLEGLRKALLRGRKKGRPFSPAAWRLLHRLPLAAVRAIVRPRVVQGVARFASLETLARVGGSLPPVAFVRGLVDWERHRTVPADDRLLVRFVRRWLGAFRGAMASGRLVSFRDDESQPVRAWFLERGAAAGFPRTISTWRSLEARTAAWQRTPGVRGARCWESPIGAGELAGVRYRPLLSEPELVAEGRELNHCSASYGDACADGRSRLFALRSETGEASTLELARAGRGWAIAQLCGPENAKPTEVHRQVAAVVYRRFVELAG